MLRDFSDEKKNELKTAVESAETTGFWAGIGDWISDWFIGDRISDYEGDVKEFHRQIVDKKDTTLQQLESIFTEVYTVETRYAKIFSTAIDRLDLFASSISSIADVLDPSPNDEGEFVFLRTQSELNSMLAPIKGVVDSEKFYALLRESKNTDEMFLTPFGIIYKGELYPISSLPSTDEINGSASSGETISAARTLVYSANLFDNEVSLAEFIVGWLGAEPSSVEYTWSQYNDVIEDGYNVYHSEKTNENLDGASFLIDGFNAWGNAHHTYTINVSLYQNPDGTNSASLNLTSDKYNAWRQNLPVLPDYRENVRLPDGRIGDIKMTFDPNRALSPYIASIYMNDQGQLVAQPHIYPGDQVIAGEHGPLGGWNPYTVPFSTYEPEAPEAVSGVHVPYDVTNDFLRPESLVLNEVYYKLIEGLQ